MAIEIKTGTKEEIKDFMNENDLALSDVVIAPEGTTNHFVLFYDEPEE